MVRFNADSYPHLLEVKTALDDHDWTYSGTNDADTLSGRGGNDSIHGTGGDDILHGDSGDDKLWGQGGNDRVFAGEGHDQVWGGDGNDWLFGGAGDDVLEGGSGNDHLYGGSGSKSSATSLAPGDRPVRQPAAAADARCQGFAGGGPIHPGEWPIHPIFRLGPRGFVVRPL